MLRGHARFLLCCWVFCAHSPASCQSPQRLNAAPSCVLREEAGRRFFILFATTRPRGLAACRLLSRHPELNCSGDVYSPHSSSGATARQRAELTLEQQRAEPVRFLRSHYATCNRRVCGVLLLQDSLPLSSLHQLFPPHCSVTKLLLRHNATGGGKALPRRGAADSGDAAAANDARAAAWLNRASKSPPHHSKSVSIPPETPLSGKSTSAAESSLVEIFDALDVRKEDSVCLYEHCTAELAASRRWREALELTKGHVWAGERLSRALAQMKARRSAAGVPFRQLPAAEEAPSSGSRFQVERQNGRRSIIGSAAAGSFVFITVGGVCLALGIAIGQRFRV